ncbi:MAG: lytic transglycosylase domain-containing protein [Peptoniphilaceae bacterium]|nr:lytic transglycosylase domain-containing protein [Peptoniphilaceae bacterium]MDY6018590.1 lytic transglycosylase domain-containing protein [Anaerococcus sp.]
MKFLKALLKFILIIVLLAAMAVGISFAIVAYQTSREHIAYQEEINHYAKEYNVDPLLVASIVKVESDFDTNAQSNQAAKGLMQLLDDSARHAAELIGEKYLPEKLNEVSYNLNLGVAYYDYLYRYYNNIDLALAAYNGGIGNVDEWIKKGIIDKNDPNVNNIPIDETRQYVTKVTANYEVMKTFYKDGLPSKKELSNRKELAINNYKKFARKILQDIL